MGSSKSIIQRSDVLSLHAGVTAMAAPTLSTDGVSTSTLWRGGFSERSGVIALWATGAFSMTNVTLYGYLSTTGKWYAIAVLNQGDAIAMTATVGYAEKVFDIASFDRLALSASFTGTASADYLPMVGNS